jgi:DNA-directed RNA polymerase specialized sigma24 family protein
MQNLISLDESEYFYLNERFDIMSEQDVRELPAYIVSSKKAKLRAIIDLAVRDELDGVQREYVTEHYGGGLNISQIAKKHSVSRQNVYRVLDAAQKKLYKVLKYAYFCGFSLVEPPKNLDELIAISEEGDKQ